MRTTRISNIFIENPLRMAGVYHIVYSATMESGKTGLLYYVYEYNKRDIVEEILFAEPSIAEEVKEYLEDESPSCMEQFSFPVNEEVNSNIAQIKTAKETATVLIMSCDEDGDC